MANDVVTRQELEAFVIDQFGSNIIQFGPLVYEGTQHGYSNVEVWSGPLYLRGATGEFEDERGQTYEKMLIINGPLQIILMAGRDGTRFGTPEEAATFAIGLLTITEDEETRKQSQPGGTTPSA